MMENPLTGIHEPIEIDERRDFKQEIARCAFADMLHDDERNYCYHEAIRKAIDQVHHSGKKAVVLDIGTGSGLLAMMAATCGAEVVYACEEVEEIAKCAKQVIEDNQLEDKIHVIPKNSTKLQVGPGKDIPEQANIIVAEVFDTELIGEGAIETFRDACRRLATEDCIMIPYAASWYAQVLESSFLRSCRTPNAVQVTPELKVEIPPSVLDCPGSLMAFDIQLSQLKTEDFVCVTRPVIVFSYIFPEMKELENEESERLHLMAETEAVCHAVVMWWMLQMDQDGDIQLSCAPHWAHPDGRNQAWRDHWIQAVYFPPKEIKVVPWESFSLVVRRRRCNICVSLSKSSSPEEPELPHCTCGLHRYSSHTRVSALSDSSRHAIYHAALRKVITQDSVCLCVGSDIMLPLMASKLGAEVYVILEDGAAGDLLKSYADYNEAKNITLVQKDAFYLCEQQPQKRASVLLGEPHFSTSTLPWHNLKFWFRKHSLRHLMCPEDGLVTIPQGFCLKAVAVEFAELWKIKAPVCAVGGLDLRSFASLIQEAQSVADDPVEPQPLWEYPCKAMTKEFVMLQLDLKNDPDMTSNISSSGVIAIESNGSCNGLALWTEFKLDSSNSITSGPTQEIVPGQQIVWDRFSRQGVHLLKNTSLYPKVIKWDFTFSLSNGCMSFDFEGQ